MMMMMNTYIYICVCVCVHADSQCQSCASDYTLFSWSVSATPQGGPWSPSPSLDSFFAMSFCATRLECHLSLKYWNLNGEPTKTRAYYKSMFCCMTNPYQFWLVVSTWLKTWLDHHCKCDGTCWDIDTQQNGSVPKSEAHISMQAIKICQVRFKSVDDVTF